MGLDFPELHQVGEVVGALLQVEVGEGVVHLLVVGEEGVGAQHQSSVTTLPLLQHWSGWISWHRQVLRHQLLSAFLLTCVFLALQAQSWREDNRSTVIRSRLAG